MYFTDIFIRRPVFATVLSLLILLVGLKSFFSLPIRQYPNIQPSVVSVFTTYSGASARLMESFITTPLEGALGAVQGIDYMDSTSAQGKSEITLHFKLGYDINMAMADTTNAVSSVRSRLPSGADDPIIAKQDPSAEPTIFFSFSSDKMTGEEITDYIIRLVLPQLQILPGVGEARILNRQEYAMRLWLDPKRMAAHNITPQDINNALSHSNVQTAPGQLKAPYLELNVNVKTDLMTADQFNNIVLKADKGYLIRFQDVGHAELGRKDDIVSVNINGNKNVIILGIIPQSTANPLDISKEVYKLLPEIEKSMPPGMKIHVDWDSSKFIDASLKEVKKTFIEATIFVVLVIFLFLGSWRTVLIPVVTIPLSIIGVCAIMLSLDYTINTLTLLAWVLAIGLVVDDAIVVLENIHRHIELGKKPFAAALVGTREIGFAIIAMTFTLAAVYAPIGFMNDITGHLFREFAFTLAGAVIVSGFVALTLTPMMCSKFLHHEVNKKGLVNKVDEIFNNLMARYRKVLQKTLAQRGPMVLLAIFIYFGCYFLYTTLPSELAPHEDQGAILTFVTAPTSANLAYIEKYTGQLQQIYEKLPEKEGIIMINGVPASNNAISYLVLKPWSERTRSVDEIIPTLYPKLANIAGINAFALNLPPLPGTSGHSPIEFVLKSSGSYEELQKAAQKLITAANESGKLINLDFDLKLNKPQIVVTIDRNKASMLGISAEDIGNALNTLLGGPSPSKFEISGRTYNVIPQIEPSEMQYPQQLDNIHLRTASGLLVPLSSLVQTEESVSPQILNHFQQLRSTSITGSMSPGYTQSQALEFLKQKAGELLPQNIQLEPSGQLRQFVQASGSMNQTLIFAILFIFLILAAQFESFRDPLIVMISVPLSLTGALLTLHLTGATLNIYTQIGLITLIGLITKHGILIVEFANQQQAKGLEIKEAVIAAAVLRLRPILMTTGAMLLGALPLIISSGAGAISRNQLGWTIFGGMAFGTFFTIFIVPTFYSFMATRKETPTVSDESLLTKKPPQIL